MNTYFTATQRDSAEVPLQLRTARANRLVRVSRGMSLIAVCLLFAHVPCGWAQATAPAKSTPPATVPGEFPISLEKELVIVIPESPGPPADSPLLSGEVQILRSDLPGLDDASFHWKIQEQLQALKVELQSAPAAGKVVISAATSGSGPWLEVQATSNEISRMATGSVRVTVKNSLQMPPGVYRGKIDFEITYLSTGPVDDKLDEKGPDEAAPEAGKDPSEGVKPLYGRINFTIVRGGRFVSRVRVVDSASPLDAKSSTPAAFGRPLRIEVDVDTFGTAPSVDKFGVVNFHLSGTFNGTRNIDLAHLTLPLNEILWHTNGALYKRVKNAAAPVSNSGTTVANPSAPEFKAEKVVVDTDSSRLFNWLAQSEGGPPSWRDPVVWAEVKKMTTPRQREQFHPTFVDSPEAKTSGFNTGFAKRHTYLLRVPAIDIPDAKVTIEATAVPMDNSLSSSPYRTTLTLPAEGLSVFPAIAYEGQEVTIVLATPKDLGKTIKVKLTHADLGSKAGAAAYSYEVLLQRHGDHKSYRSETGGDVFDLIRPRLKSGTTEPPRRHAAIRKAGTWDISLDPHLPDFKNLPASCRVTTATAPLASFPQSQGPRPKTFFVFLNSTPSFWGFYHWSWHIKKKSDFYLPTSAWEAQKDSVYSFQQVPGYYDHGRLLLGTAHCFGDSEVIRKKLFLFSVQAGLWPSGSKELVHDLELVPQQPVNIAMRATFNDDVDEKTRKKNWKRVQENIVPDNISAQSVKFEIPHLVVLTGTKKDQNEQEVSLFTVPVVVRLEKPDVDNYLLLASFLVAVGGIGTLGWVIWKMNPRSHKPKKLATPGAESVPDVPRTVQPPSAPSEPYQPGALDN